jgi:hypothetical protein
MIRRLATTFAVCSMFTTAAAAESANAADAAQRDSTDRPANPVEYPSHGTAAAASADAATPPATEQKAAETALEKKWKFATIGYVWFAGASGKIDVIGPLAPAKMDLSFKEVFTHLEFPWAIMGAAEARHDRLVLFGDLMWVKIGASKDIKFREIDLLSGSFSTNTLLATALGGYNVARDGPIKVDLLGGARLNGTKTDARVSGPNRSFSGELNKKWVTPVIAIRAIAPLGGKFGVAAYADYAGVSNSNKGWQALGTLTYQVSRKMRLGFGYRYYKVDYASGHFLYDFAYHGPILAFRTDF